MGNYKMKFIVTKLIYLLIFIVGLSVFAEETSLEGAYIWTLKSPVGSRRRTACDFESSWESR